MLNRENLKIWAIVSTVVWGVASVISLPIIIMSPMAFDAPGSTDNIALVTGIIALVTFPIVNIISITMVWLLYRYRKRKAQLVFCLFPLLNIIIFVIGMILW